MTSWSFHCAYCGRFVSWGADSFTPFGSGEQLDPPEPEHLCQRCVRRLERDAARDRRLPTHWIPARWEHRIAKRLGFVQAGPKGAAWSHWYAPENVPTDYELVRSAPDAQEPPTRGDA